MGIRFIESYGVTILFFVILGLSAVSGLYMPDDISVFMTENRFLSALIFALLMCIATVIAPIALLPSVPMIAPILGPFTTALACWFGWTMGALIAFLIARHGGKPLIERFVRLEKLSRFESRIPEETHFALIFALRMAIPVDILSYALGLFSTVSFKTYAVASGVGILWFSFAFSYLGYAVAFNETVLFLVYSVLSAIIFVGALWYVRRVMHK